MTYSARTARDFGGSATAAIDVVDDGLISHDPNK